MSSASAFVLLVSLVGLERVAELVVSTRHVRAARARGGVERGRGHYPAMVVLHTALLVGAPVEVLVLHRPFLAWLGTPMLVAVVLAQGLRWWCVHALGPAWSTRVVVVPGDRLVRTGPYRRLRHPNYAAVVVEGVALPLVHTAWLTAAVFSVANAAVLRVRLRCENAALRELVEAPA